MIHAHKGAGNIPITPALVSDHVRAHQKYRERLEKEKREKMRQEKEIRRENELRRKREADQLAKSDFETKKKRYNEDESQLRQKIQFDEVRLTELEDRADNTTVKAEYTSARAAIKLLREGLKQSRLELDNLSAEKSKLVGKYEGCVT